MAHVVNLISIAMMDGVIAEPEKELLYQIADHLGITEEEFDECLEICINNPGKVIYEVPETEEEKVSFLRNLAIMMMVDGSIDERERTYLSNIADRFGYEGDKVVDILIENISKEVQEGVKDAGSNDTGDDEEMSQEELKKRIQQNIDMGKKALEEHKIQEAFDCLFIPGLVDIRGQSLLLMIVNQYHRLRLITEEQIKQNQVEEFAEKGYPVAQYIMGRYHQQVKPDDDSIEKAKKWFDAAKKAGVGDAFGSEAIMWLDGYYGLVDMDKYHALIKEGCDKGASLNYCSFALYRVLRDEIFGLHGTQADPQHVIDEIKNALDGNESDDIEEVDPTYYALLGYAYDELGDKKTAGEYYLKAMDMGYYETIADYILLSTPDKDSTPEVWKAWKNLCNTALQYAVSRSYVIATQFYEKDYDELSNEEKRERTAEIMKYLQNSHDLGNEFADYVIGLYYYFGMNGFEEDNEKAWNWLSRGAYLEDGYCYSLLAQMIEEGNAPEGYDLSWADEFRLQALRRGDSEQLKKVVEIYRSGRLTNFAREIESLYIPQYEQQLAENPEEEPEEEDYEEDDEIERKLIAVIKTDRTADIFEFDVENWDELPAFVDAKRLDAIRVQPLYDIGQQVGYTSEHITGWVDNMGLLKELPMNPVGCEIYPGPIAGDMILTLEDSKYNPMSFTSLSDLKEIIAKLGAQLVNVNLDDGPDDDGRYDAWA